MGRPIMTHEIGWLADAIKEKSKADFMELCKAESEEKMTHKENIKAILECYFVGFKDEIIESACNRILELDRILYKIRTEIDAESERSIGYPNWERAKALEWVIAVIDKYNVESEVKNEIDM